MSEDDAVEVLSPSSSSEDERKAGRESPPKQSNHESDKKERKNSSSPKKKGNESTSDRSPLKSRKQSGSSKKKGEATVVIRTRKPDPAVDPILCSFPAGMPAALQKDTSPEEATLPRFVIKKHHKGSKLVVGKDHACLYSAVATPNKAAKRPMQLVVGIYDKHKKQVILQPTADQGFVYAMSQSVPSYNRTSSANRDAERMMSPADRRKALFEDFGSAKKRKVMRSQEANRVNVESVVGAGNVDSILESMSESNRHAVEERRDGTDPQDRVSAADLATVEWRKNFLPAYNEQAESPADVYSAKEIAGNVVWNRLLNRVSKCLAHDNVLAAIVEGPKKDGEEDDAAAARRRKAEWYPSVVRILKLLVPKGEAAKQQLACAILLNHYLHLWNQLHKKRFFPGVEGSDRSRYFGVPLDVGRRWLECFTTSTSGNDGQMGHIMSKANKDSCCVHVCLLSLIAEGGNRVRSDNVQPLADDLQMDVKDASHLLRLAGCTVTRKITAQTTAALTTPLKFPSMKKGGRRK